MGSGKSTIAIALSERLSWQWHDTDDDIVRRTGLPISEIFRRYGEDDFRSLESSALYRSAQQEHAVIATGGGAPCHNDNLNLMKKQGEVVYLRCSVDALVDRLSKEREHRPLVSSISSKRLPDHIRDHLNEREEYYSQADYVIDADQPVDRIVDAIVASL